MSLFMQYNEHDPEAVELCLRINTKGHATLLTILNASIVKDQSPEMGDLLNANDQVDCAIVPYATWERLLWESVQYRDLTKKLHKVIHVGVADIVQKFRELAKDWEVEPVSPGSSTEANGPDPF